jgi:hypothetical protein
VDNGGVPAIDGKDRLLTLGACCFGLFMVMLDNTVVNVALASPHVLTVRCSHASLRNLLSD